MSVISDGKRKVPLLAFLLFSTVLAEPPISAATFTHPTKGYTLDYPRGWNATPQKDGVSLKNFQTYEHGGIVPDGCSEIRVGILPSALNEYDLVKEWSKFGKNVVLSVDPAMAVYEEPANGMTKLVIAFRRGGLLFSVFLDYYTENPNGPSLQQAAIDVMNTLTPVASTDNEGK